ncbi:MAG: hypothetical protein AAGG50_08810 [Bacteroidota bacterium]
MNRCESGYEAYVAACERVSELREAWNTQFAESEYPNPLTRANHPAWLEYKAAERERQKRLEQSVALCLVQIGESHAAQDQFVRAEVLKIIEKAHDQKAPFFLIWLTWTLTEQGDPPRRQRVECREELCALARFWLKRPKLDGKAEYHLECIVDILDLDYPEPVPLDIVVDTCLAEHQGEGTRYGAIIKASLALWRHRPEEQARALEQIRASNRYLNDEYFRGWFDQEGERS